jgi:hypothetical protein
VIIPVVEDGQDSRGTAEATGRPVLFPDFYHRMPRTTGKPTSPENIVQVIAMVSSMIAAGSAFAYFEQNGDMPARERFLARFQSGSDDGEAFLRMPDEMIDFLWAWSPTRHDALRRLPGKIFDLATQLGTYRGARATACHRSAKNHRMATSAGFGDGLDDADVLHRSLSLLERSRTTDDTDSLWQATNSWVTRCVSFRVPPKRDRLRWILCGCPLLGHSRRPGWMTVDEVRHDPHRDVAPDVSGLPTADPRSPCSRVRK